MRHNTGENNDIPESLISTGNLGGIVGLVSSYWDTEGYFLKSSTDVKPHGMRSDPGERVGYLDPSKGFNSSIFSPPSAPVDIRASVLAQSTPAEVAPPLEQTLKVPHVPNEVRMITHSDSIPRPDLPAPAPPALPNLSESPLISLIAAASVGELDLQWLESFDNTTLESVVPREAVTGRPLTIGSIQHSSGNCRPCIFFLKAKCFKGIRCSFCHFNHSALRKQIAVPANGSGAIPTGNAVKTKRLRPSKRTREMIKQINDQMAFDDVHEDPSGPPLSVSQAAKFFKSPSVLPFL